MGNKKYVTYILRCNDGSYYTGVTDNLEKRMLQHEMGEADEFSYTYTRRPVVLVHSPASAPIAIRNVRPHPARMKAIAAVGLLGRE